jgi:hypothetical protein
MQQYLEPVLETGLFACSEKTCLSGSFRVEDKRLLKLIRAFRPHHIPRPQSPDLAL